MEEPKKEFIQGIADLFEDYEEAYVPGEWEAFAQQRRKKYPFAPMWLKVAAVLLLIGAAALYQLTGPSKIAHPTEVVKGKPNKVMAEPATGKAQVPVITNPAIPVGDPVVQQRPSLPDLQKDKTVESTVYGSNNGIPATATQNVLAGVSPTPSVNMKLDNSIGLVKAIQSPGMAVAQQTKTAGNQTSALVNANMMQDAKTKDTAGKLNTMDFLLAESRNPVKTKEKTTAGSKWDFGVAVAPSVSRSNMNIAGGVTTAYRLSNKFSISSGVSLMQLESGNAVSAPSVAKVSVSSLSQKELLAIDANIKAIDIPVGVVYQISKHVYTSAGVSYFNVLSEKRSNTYGSTTQASEVYSDPATGFLSDRAVLNSVAVEEPVTETPLKGNSYLGFFNFSIGRKQQIFNKYNILIEPFIKVPIGKLSTQELNLMNSGLKFQISF